MFKGKNIFKANKGITLISLIVLIIVLIILAGVAINTLAGDNGVINKAIKAGEMSEVATFKDEASLAYEEIISSEKKGQIGVFNVTIDEVIDRLINGYNYDSNRFVTVINGDVELIETDLNETLQVLIGTPIVKRAITSTDATTNYIEIKGKYYKFNLENGKIKVGEGLTEKPTNGTSSTLSVESLNPDIVEVAKTNMSENNFEITITGKTETAVGEHAAIKISYGEKESTINVEVKAVCTLDVSSEDTSKGSVSIEPSAVTENKYIKGTEVTLTATPKEGTEYIFKGWYEGTDTTDSTKLIEGAGSTYTFTLDSNTTLIAKFGEDVIDNSGSLVDGFVDDLGTRAMIYLYANPETCSAGETITITDNNGATLKNVDGKNQTTVKAVAKNADGKLEITGTSYDDGKNYYLAYPVTKNGTYTFKATKSTKTGVTEPTTTTIKVKNIETFTAIEDVKENGASLSYYNSDNKAYSYKGAAVPKGYYVDEKSSVDTGLVITDSVDSNGYSNGNEWVWVPVNSTVGNDDYYGTESTATALAGATDVTYTKYSKLYSFNGTTREDYGTFHPVRTTTATLSKPSTTSSPGYREIAILTNGTTVEGANYGSINNRTTGTAFTNVTDVAIQYKNDYDSMVSSVDKYHGFYIGRYELSNIGGTAKEKPGNSYTNETWYSLYNKCLTFGKKDSNNMQITESSMMYGALWDATMQWLANSNISVGYTGNDTSGYGNYKEENVIVSNENNNTIKVKSSGTSTKLQTGQTSYTGRKNIYDISGNCLEWTQEANGTYLRVARGGGYNDVDKSNACCATGRSASYQTNYLDGLTSRSQLYIKVELNS